MKEIIKITKIEAIMISSVLSYCIENATDKEKKSPYSIYTEIVRINKYLNEQVDIINNGGKR